MSVEQKNPYDFIMNEPPKIKASKFGGASMSRRLLVVAGGGVILIVLMVLVFGVILKGGDKGADALYQVAASQQDIVDLTTLGNSNIRDQQLLNLSTTANLVVSSHYSDIKTYISKSSFSKNSAAKITALRDEQYKKVLDEAKISGTYDESFQAILSNRLDLYRTQLQSAFAATSSQTLKNKLNAEYMQINDLNNKD